MNGFRTRVPEGVRFRGRNAGVTSSTPSFRARRPQVIESAAGLL
jgi:hypothetical protein